MSTDNATPDDFYDRARASAAGLLERSERERQAYVEALRRRDAGFAALVEQQMRVLVALGDQELSDRALRLANMLIGTPPAQRAARLIEIRTESPILHDLVVDGMRAVRRANTPVLNAHPMVLRRRRRDLRDLPDSVESRADAVARRRTPAVPSYREEVAAQYAEPEGHLFPRAVLDAAAMTPEDLRQLRDAIERNANDPRAVTALPAGVTYPESPALHQARRLRAMEPAARATAMEHLQVFDHDLFVAVDALLRQMARSFDGATLPVAVRPPPLPTLGDLMRQFRYIPDTHVPARIAAWIVLQPSVTHPNLFPEVDATWPPYGLQVRQEYLNFLNDNDYFAMSRWSSSGPIRTAEERLIDEAMALVPGSAATGRDSPRPVQTLDPRVADAPEVPIALYQTVEAFERAVAERHAQRARVGDWVAIVESSRSFTKLPPGTHPVQPQSTMGPGRPLTHIGTVDRFEYRLNASRNVMMEHVWIVLDGRTHEGHRVMPGATDNTLMLPCAVPGCTRPHLNDHPFCRSCRCDDPSVERVGQVERRLQEVRTMLEAPNLMPETRTAMEADAQVLHEYVRDKRDVARRRQQAEERRRMAEEERQRAAAAAQEEQERLELARLMAKHGVKAQPKPAEGGPAEGERNLEL